MTDQRFTADTITDDQLDALYAELETQRAKVAEYEHSLNWHTTCLSCARVLDSCYAETVRAEQAEAHRDQLAAALREALDVFNIRVREEEGTSPVAYLAANAVHPDDMARWRAALNPPKEN